MLISLWFTLLHSGHHWGFPRRWREFDGKRNVDVQTCTTCGARRISPVQFGRGRKDAPAPDPQLQEVRA